ncbi:winged helix-turn-helix transcriptional regulator [Caenimonas sedimenti]|uniref:Winged helix-turn-helix transcriptional regulator n=1 Tax=Caenimonas sedimenti TaxID=2596921 RepID=A0A562ZUP5_9BURK|nr:MarR family winged helix-turn-helix transcriptional regulator [Caenimonas sedimenti]TWO71874.1 winged helix-turn-helix transcriptional regulator [Caenimonas sedimenti]
MRPPPASESLEHFLSWRLHRVSKLSDKVTAEAYAVAFALPLGEARCLAAIGNAAPMSVNDLAGAANLDKGQASRAAQALVARGLVAKHGSASDRRAVVLEPTEEGEALWLQVMELIAHRNEAIFGCLSHAERAGLARMLDRVIEAAEEPGPIPAEQARKRRSA